jgi:predicted kinase
MPEDSQPIPPLLTDFDAVNAMTSTTPTLVVMIGLPASGKTTLARQITAELGALRLTPDEWMIPLFNDSDADGKRDVLEGRFIWLAMEALRVGTSVVLDFGVWSKHERSGLRYMAEEVGARCELRYIATNHDEQVRRIALRKVSDADTTFDIGDDDLRRYASLFEEPDAAELNSPEIDAPPAGYDTWLTWVAERWPTSIG